MATTLPYGAIGTIALRTAVALFLGVLLMTTSQPTHVSGPHTWIADGMALCAQGAAVVLLVYVSVVRDLDRDAVVVGRFALPHGAQCVAHPLAHAMPTVAGCTVCGEAYGIDDPVCFSDGRARVAYAFAVAQCPACESVQPGAWTRRSNDDQWTDIVDQTRLADHGSDDHGDGASDTGNMLRTQTTRDLCVREVAADWGIRRPFVMPVDAREVAVVLALDAADGGATKSVVWTRITRHRPWPWYFV
ncbi:hypothetical protein pqer_cds_298 [Pandoravirus quercus]|uniref:Uncharacterized protein n=1 Tax=Pandoravirus quercus TaxID=2107709 RepID=A0A2U7U8G7_9VIRU|nr:hypothetical protein pqer_cds_298 [Pandoravirus quercus]AVK74720.1 hypothetical protein pqer_cds_298 [Pandoravirus quercus]